MNYTIKINSNELKDRYLNKALGSIIYKFTDSSLQTKATNAAFLSTIDVNFETFRARVNKMMPSEEKVVFESLLTAVEENVLDFIVKKSGTVTVDQYRYENGLAMEAITDFAAEDTDLDGLSDSAVELLQDMADRHSVEIKQMAKTILKMQKEKQDEARAMAEEEDDAFVEEGEQAEDQTQQDGENAEEGDNPFGDDAEASSDNSDDTNPFGDDSDADAESNDDSADSDNPFGDGSEGDDNSQEENADDEDNPFGEQPQQQENQEGDGQGQDDNPFADTGETDQVDNADSENIFESVNPLNKCYDVNAAASKLLSNIGITKKEIVDFCTKYVGYHMEPKMRECLDVNGMESAQFKDLQTNYVKMTELAIESACNCIAFMYHFELGIDVDKIKYTY